MRLRLVPLLDQLGIARGGAGLKTGINPGHRCMIRIRGLHRFSPDLGQFVVLRLNLALKRDQVTAELADFLTDKGAGGCAGRGGRDNPGCGYAGAGCANGRAGRIGFGPSRGRRCIAIFGVKAWPGAFRLGAGP